MSEKGNSSDFVTMKIDPEIFEELGVRDPEELKREMAITKKVRQVKKELKTDPDNLDLLVELSTLYMDGGEYEDATKMLRNVLNKDNKN